MNPTPTTPSTPVPGISVVLPTLDERAFIRDCLDSLLAQTLSRHARSSWSTAAADDGTREIVTAVGPPVRLVDNPRVTAAAAMNVGIAAGRTT